MRKVKYNLVDHFLLLHWKRICDLLDVGWKLLYYSVLINLISLFFNLILEFLSQTQNALLDKDRRALGFLPVFFNLEVEFGLFKN